MRYIVKVSPSKILSLLHNCVIIKDTNCSVLRAGGCRYDAEYQEMDFSICKKENHACFFNINRFFSAAA